MGELVDFSSKQEGRENLKQSYNMRRPMLTHIAGVIKHEIIDFFADNQVYVDVTSTVLSGDQFVQLADETKKQNPLVELTAQVFIQIVAGPTHSLSDLDNLLDTHYHTIKDESVDRDSHLAFQVRIPTQAKPEGYRERLDVPNLLQISIVNDQSACLLYTSPSPRD